MQHPEPFVFPLITEMKAPEWVSFVVSPLSQDRYIPHIKPEHLLKLAAYMDHLPLEGMFWWLLLKRNMGMMWAEPETKWFDLILRSEVKLGDQIGFQPVSHEIEVSNMESPDIISTFYALGCFWQLGRLEEYLIGFDGKRRTALLNFCGDCVESKKQQKKISNLTETQLIFFVLSIYQMLGLNLQTVRSKILPFLKHPGRNASIMDRIFWLLDLLYLGSGDLVEEEDLLKLHQTESTDPETFFWIGYTLENYKWILPYRAGPLFRTIEAQLHRFVENVAGLVPSTIDHDVIMIRDLSQAVVLICHCFNSVLTELEEVIFSNLSQAGLMNLNILSVQAGFQGAETEVVRLLNQKYRFSLEILENEMLFRRFLNRLNPLEEKIAIELRAQIQDQTQLDLTDFRKSYNRRKSRANRVKEEEVHRLVTEMVDHYFFTGELCSRSRLIFGKHYFFLRDRIIDKILVCSRAVSLELLKKEKHRMEDVILQIYNMVREIKNSSSLILEEINSLIITGMDPEIIEERMTYNMKKTLFDAALFQKTIQNYPTEFELLKAEYLLSSHISQWDQICNSIQKTFTNNKRILMIKIATLREAQNQYQTTVTLERLVNDKTALLIEEFDIYQTQYRKQLEAEYARNKVLQLIEDMQLLQDRVSQADLAISTHSHQITSKDTTIVEFRRKIINHWVSQLDEIRNVIAFYEFGFSQWRNKIQIIDVHYATFQKLLAQLEQDVAHLVTTHEYQQALEFLDKNIPEVKAQIDTIDEQVKKDAEEISKKERKLIPLFRGVYSEWTAYETQLISGINAKRDLLHGIIQSDLAAYLKENLAIVIDTAVTELQQDLAIFERDFYSQLSAAKLPDNSQFIKNIKKLEASLDQKSEMIQNKIKSTQTHYTSIEIDPILTKFVNYQQTFSQRLVALQMKFTEEQLISHILSYASQNNTCLFPISALISRGNPYEGSSIENLLEQIRKLIAEDRLNTQIVNVPPHLELHNSDWRNYEKLKKYNESILRELENELQKIQALFEKSKAMHDFSRNQSQIMLFLETFRNRLHDILHEHDQFVESLRVNLKNSLLFETYQAFQTNLQQFTQNADKIEQITKILNEYEQFLISQLAISEDIMQTAIYRLSVEIDRRKLYKFAQNKAWFEQQKTKIMEEMNTIQNNISEYKNQHDFHAIQDSILDIERNFEQRKQQLMANAILQLDEQMERLGSFDLQQMTEEIETLLHTHQENMVQMIQNSDLEIKTKIRSKDYLTAAKKLVNREKLIEKVKKDPDKLIRSTLDNQASRSAVFRIKYLPYYKDQWKLFLEEYDEVHNIAMDTILRRELVMEFTKFAGKSLKEGFIPLNMIAETLLTKREIVSHILMGLIADGQLPGKIDLKYDIYIESAHTDTDQLDGKTVATLDLIRKTNVKTYLFLQRLSNIFAILAPFLAGIASLLTITWYISRLSSNMLIILAPIALFIGFLIFLWIKRGRDKAIKGQLVNRPKRKKSI